MLGSQAERGKLGEGRGWTVARCPSFNQSNCYNQTYFSFTPSQTPSPLLCRYLVLLTPSLPIFMFWFFLIFSFFLKLTFLSLCLPCMPPTFFGNSRLLFLSSGFQSPLLLSCPCLLVFYIFSFLRSPIGFEMSSFTEFYLMSTFFSLLSICVFISSVIFESMVTLELVGHLHWLHFHSQCNSLNGNTPILK